MDNFCVPKAINRHVMQAFTALQGKRSGTMFVLADSIIQQVQYQMRRNRRLLNVECNVKKCLSSLTHLGILVRSGTSEYALRQNLEFDQGVSAIPWQTSESAKKIVKPKRTVKKPKSLTTKSRNIKNGIIKTKLRETVAKSIGPTSKCDHTQFKRNCVQCMESHPAYSALLNSLNEIGRPIKNMARSVTDMEVDPMNLHTESPDVKVTAGFISIVSPCLIPQFY
ncbi:uncharacterized protein LOC117787857 [Drosophila innubila]|uniref:uncharacterized protein LOC117787857 n=1 Tax=Drosophila innubila TaxID=198719 RepID=UPI00148B53C5|nr:uncharacterized protein LOC117787857 [Drosophila innubila]